MPKNFKEMLCFGFGEPIRLFLIIKQIHISMNDILISSEESWLITVTAQFYVNECRKCLAGNQ